METRQLLTFANIESLATFCDGLNNPSIHGDSISIEIRESMIDDRELSYSMVEDFKNRFATFIRVICENFKELTLIAPSVVFESNMTSTFSWTMMQSNNETQREVTKTVVKQQIFLINLLTQAFQHGNIKLESLAISSDILASRFREHHFDIDFDYTMLSKLKCLYLIGERDYISRKLIDYLQEKARIWNFSFDCGNSPFPFLQAATVFGGGLPLIWPAQQEHRNSNLLNGVFENIEIIDEKCFSNLQSIIDFTVSLSRISNTTKLLRIELPTKMVDIPFNAIYKRNNIVAIYYNFFANICHKFKELTLLNPAAVAFMECDSRGRINIQSFPILRGLNEALTRGRLETLTISSNLFENNFDLVQQFGEKIVANELLKDVYIYLEENLSSNFMEFLAYLEGKVSVANRDKHRGLRLHLGSRATLEAERYPNHNRHFVNPLLPAASVAPQSSSSDSSHYSVQRERDDASGEFVQTFGSFKDDRQEEMIEYMRELGKQRGSSMLEEGMQKINPLTACEDEVNKVMQSYSHDISTHDGPNVNHQSEEIREAKRDEREIRIEEGRSKPSRKTEDYSPELRERLENAYTAGVLETNPSAKFTDVVPDEPRRKARLSSQSYLGSQTPYSILHGPYSPRERVFEPSRAVSSSGLRMFDLHHSAERQQERNVTLDESSDMQLDFPVLSKKSYTGMILSDADRKIVAEHYHQIVTVAWEKRMANSSGNLALVFPRKVNNIEVAYGEIERVFNLLYPNPKINHICDIQRTIIDKNTGKTDNHYILVTNPGNFMRQAKSVPRDLMDIDKLSNPYRI